jgi:hypothetical protein
VKLRKIESKRFFVVLLIWNYRAGKFTKDHFDLAKTVIEEWRVAISIVVTHFEILFQEYWKEPDDDLAVSFGNRCLEIAPA